MLSGCRFTWSAARRVQALFEEMLFQIVFVWVVARRPIMRTGGEVVLPELLSTFRQNSTHESSPTDAQANRTRGQNTNCWTQTRTRTQRCTSFADGSLWRRSRTSVERTRQYHTKRLRCVGMLAKLERLQSAQLAADIVDSNAIPDLRDVCYLLTAKVGDQKALSTN